MDQVLLIERVEYLCGQVTALQATVRGLIAASPHPAVAERIVKHMLEEAQGEWLGFGVSDVLHAARPLARC